MAKKHKKGPRRYTKQGSVQPSSAHAGPHCEVSVVAAPSRPLDPPAPSRFVTLSPIDPIIVRSGRPFDGWTGVDPARVPPPSTVAGCLRTAGARAQGMTFPLARDRATAAERGVRLAAQAVAGPLLLRGSTLLLPKPADALYFWDKGAPRCIRAEPRPLDHGCGMDLPEGLTPVQLTEAVQGKPAPGPAWWTFQDWTDFRRGREIPHADLMRRGWSVPSGDRRTHVAIAANTQAAADGQLFQTEGLDFGPALNRGSSSDSEPEPLRLLAKFSEPLGPALVHLGGERRLAAVAPVPDTIWPQAPEGWFEAIAKAGGLSLTLMTPGIFARGSLPGWLDDQRCGVPPAGSFEETDTVSLPWLKLAAVAVDRWQPHSGWDLARQQPRATRKLVAAGATYWFSFTTLPDLDALRALWLTSVCDDEQDRRDGFGLVLPAPWTPTVFPE